MPKIDSKRLHQLLQDMVDIYSPSGREEQLSDYLTEYLANSGMKVDRQDVSDGRCNILVSKGGAPCKRLFLGHIDTVPAFDITRYGFSEDKDLCSGLGTSDMKGGCAAMIEAFRASFEEGILRDDVLLALVVGEEETGDGTKALLDSRTFEEAIVGEPTGLRPCFGHCGYIEMVVRAFGSRRHAAMSGTETNAIRALLRFLLKLDSKIEEEGPSTVLNIRDLHSSESGFAVPDRCAVAVDIHVTPATNTAQYAESMRVFAETELTGSVASRCEIEFPTLADGYLLDQADPLVQEFRQVLSQDDAGTIEGEIFKSHSDANLLRAAGCSAVIFGPGQLAKAHTIDEYVAWHEVEASAGIFARLAARRKH